MNLLKKIKNLIIPNKSYGMNSLEFLEMLGIEPNTPKDVLSEVTYFTCLKMLGETLGKLPIKFYQDTSNGIVKAKSNVAYKVLSLRPNPYMTSSVFWATVENNRNHHGNAYVWCRYSGGWLQDLWIMPSDCVQVYQDDKGYFGEKNKIWYVYSDKNTGKQYTFKSDDILHFKTSTSFDGITGLPVREILKNTVVGGLESQRFMNNLYATGLTGKAVLQYTGDLKDESIQKLLKGLEEFASGSKNAGKMIPIPLGFTLTPLNIKLTDSQFFELKKFSALQIASAFGIKPNQINDYEKSSYSNSETQQLSFYVDTLQFILKQYEEEITYKLLTTRELNEGFFFKFNERAILRADMKTQIETLSSAVNNGIYMVNEARAYLDLPVAEGGDQLIVNGNYIPITRVGEQYSTKNENDV